MKLAALELSQLAAVWCSVLRSGESSRDFEVDSLSLAKYYGALTIHLCVVPPEWWVDVLFALDVRYHGPDPIPFFPKSDANSNGLLNSSQFQYEFTGEKFQLNAGASASFPQTFDISLWNSDLTNRIWTQTILDGYRTVPLAGRSFHHRDFRLCKGSECIWIFGHGPTELYVSAINQFDGTILKSVTMMSFKSLTFAG